MTFALVLWHLALPLAGLLAAYLVVRRCAGIVREARRLADGPDRWRVRGWRR